MSAVLAVNAGSSSLKFALHGVSASLPRLLSGKIERIGSPGAKLSFRDLRSGEEGKSVGSLLLGLYDSTGVFHHVGHTSSFKAAEKRELVSFLEPYVANDKESGFGGGRKV